VRVLQHLVHLWPGEKARTEGLVIDAFGQDTKPYDAGQGWSVPVMEKSRPACDR
jgi:hypothetical protein